MARKTVRTKGLPRPAIARYAGAALAALAFVAAWAWVEPPGPKPADGHVGGPFTLVADDGRVVTEHSFPGKYLIVYFGYTTCRDVCPATLNTLAAAIGRLGAKAELVQPLFITLDPRRDSPAVLHRYVRAFTPALIGLTGSPAELHRAADAYGVVSVQHQDGAGYAVDHSSVLYLMAPDGRLVRPVRADADETVMARAILRGL